MNPQYPPRSPGMSSALPQPMGSRSLKMCLQALQPTLGATRRHPCQQLLMRKNGATSLRKRSSGRAIPLRASQPDPATWMSAASLAALFQGSQLPVREHWQATT